MPGRYFAVLFRIFLFWLLFFALGRLLFLIYHITKIDFSNPADTLLCFLHAIRLDASAASYLTALPWIFLSINLMARKEIFDTTIRAIVIFLLVLYSFITLSELEIYNQWGTKLSAKALQYLTQPAEIFNSLPTWLFFALLAGVALYSYAGWILFRKLIQNEFSFPPYNIYSSAFSVLLVGGLLVLILRGGWQQIPINQSDAYYTQQDLLNNAAVNPAWNLIQSVDQNRKMLSINPFVFYEPEEAQDIVDSLFKKGSDTTQILLTTEKPNIFLIILEGVSADMLSSLGGYKETAPGLDELTNEGYLFTSFYSSGDRSEQGMAALLSGFPAQPLTSILRQPTKFNKLPSLVSTYSKAGYETHYFFGGQLSYGNIKAYLISKGIGKITELSDFTNNEYQGKLGVHDGDLFARIKKEAANFKEPFFNMAFTLSTHTPYDIPTSWKKIDWAGDDQGYVNGMMYSDSCISDFMESVKKEKWYANTLFVFVSDHSHATPKHNDFYSTSHRKIPCLLYGEVLKAEYKGKRNSTIASQVDLPATLLAQCNMPQTGFVWSKDLMNPGIHPFAFNAFLDGSTGWIESNGNFAYHLTTNVYHQNNFPDTLTRNRIIRSHNAYLQVMYGNYLKY